MKQAPGHCCCGGGGASLPCSPCDLPIADLVVAFRLTTVTFGGSSFCDHELSLIRDERTLLFRQNNGTLSAPITGFWMTPCFCWQSTNTPARFSSARLFFFCDRGTARVHVNNAGLRVFGVEGGSCDSCEPCVNDIESQNDSQVIARNTTGVLMFSMSLTAENCDDLSLTFEDADGGGTPYEFATIEGEITAA